MKPFNKSDFTPAVKDPKTSQVWTGDDHQQALDNARSAGNRAVHFDNIGFLRKDGIFFTRSQTERQWGFKTRGDLKGI